MRSEYDKQRDNLEEDKLCFTFFPPLDSPRCFPTVDGFLPDRISYVVAHIIDSYSLFFPTLNLETSAER